MQLPADIPAEAVPFLREMDYLSADRLRVGDRPRPIALPPLGAGDPVTLGGPAGAPTVLIFGSYT